MTQAPQSRRAAAFLGTVVLVALTAAPLRAHDFWLGPTSFHPKIGALVGARLLVGQDMIGDPVPRDPAAIRQFVVATRSGVSPVAGRDGGDPAGIIRVDSTGLLILGYQSHPRSIELPPEKFVQYLGEEGLDEIRSLVAAKGRPAIAHELFTRCAKSLLLAGEPSATDGDRPLGLTLELTAERNPYFTAAGQPLPFVLTYEGKPRAGALVIAVNQANPAEKVRARTDAAGRVVLTLPVAGVWLVKAVHMVPAQPGAGADWQSYWASSTFQIGEVSGSLAAR